MIASQKKGITLAVRLGIPVIMKLTYNEGGNTLLSVDFEGNPYAIIGKDTYTISKALMEKSLGYKMSDDQVRIAFGIDYGLPKDKLYFVEQP